jgi:DnaK suppressor protein
MPSRPSKPPARKTASTGRAAPAAASAKKAKAAPAKQTAKAADKSTPTQTKKAAKTAVKPQAAKTTKATKATKATDTAKAAAPAKKGAGAAAPAKAVPTKAVPAKATPAKKGAGAATPAKATAAKAAPAKKGTGAATPAKKSAAKAPVLDKFLLEQVALLEEERRVYTEQAEALKAEADQLAQEMEPGDIQFDEESGEGGTMNIDRERDLALSAQARAAVEEIDHALAKMQVGTYGICESCGQPIPKARLKALPYARLCVACKSGGLSRR